MGKKKRKNKKQTVGEEVVQDILVELPSVPNFPYVSRDIAPPVNVVLILACAAGYVLGHWDWVYFFDPFNTKIESTYGKVFSWCILLDINQDAVVVEPDEE